MILSEKISCLSSTNSQRKLFGISKYAWVVIASFLSVITISAKNPIPKAMDTLSSSAYLHYKSWLPDAYIANAMCAFSFLPDDSAANFIRRFLLNALDTANAELIITATKRKSDFDSGKISEKEYRKFVKQRIVPKIYSDHVNAYRAAGCKDGPAPYWEWKVACLHTFKNCKKMLRYNLKTGGACHCENGSW